MDPSPDTQLYGIYTYKFGYVLMVNIGKYTDRVDPNGLFLWHQLVYQYVHKIYQSHGAYPRHLVYFSDNFIGIYISYIE